jgi:hypothetical protein
MDLFIYLFIYLLFSKLFISILLCNHTGNSLLEEFSQNFGYMSENKKII